MSKINMHLLNKITDWLRNYIHDSAPKYVTRRYFNIKSHPLTEHSIMDILCEHSEVVYQFALQSNNAKKFLNYCDDIRNYQSRTWKNTITIQVRWKSENQNKPYRS